MKGIKPEITMIFPMVIDIFHPWDTVITSGTEPESKHMDGSLHYTGYAIDLRTKHIDDKRAIPAIVVRLKTSIGPEYQFVLESDHIHIEFDPKEKT